MVTYISASRQGRLGAVDSIMRSLQRVADDTAPWEVPQTFKSPDEVRAKMRELRPDFSDDQVEFWLNRVYSRVEDPSRPPVSDKRGPEAAYDYARQLRERGLTYQAIADQLNALEFFSSKGIQFYKEQVANLLKRNRPAGIERHHFL